MCTGQRMSGILDYNSLPCSFETGTFIELGSRLGGNKPQSFSVSGFTWVLEYEFNSSGLLFRCHAYIDSVLIHRTISLTLLRLCTSKQYTHSCFLTQGFRCHPLAFYPNHSITILSNVKKMTLCIWVFCLYVYLCTRCMPNALRAQKRILDPLRLEL